MALPMPEVLHTYQSALLDSTRWQHYTPREDDVVVATPYKSGTTWTLNIVRRLIFLGQEVPSYEELWIDSRFQWELEALRKELEAQQHRRYLKTHLALDGLPFYPQVKYIVVGRDVRDVFMSYWNHYRAMGTEYAERINAIRGRIGPPLPPCPDDIHEAWHNWITRGWFAWERDGWPWWGNMHHMQSWWDFRHLDNILFVHFNDLKRDLAGQIGRIAEYLGIDASPTTIADMLPHLDLDSMRDEALARARDPEFARKFYFKGTNGRWRDVLSADELALYDSAAADLLDPECRAWLEGELSTEEIHR